MNMEIAIRGALGTQLFEYLCGLDFAQGAGQTVEKITISTGGKVVAPVKVDWLSQIIEVPYPINVGLGTAKQDVWKRPEVFKSLASSNIITNIKLKQPIVKNNLKILHVRGLDRTIASIDDYVLILKSIGPHAKLVGDDNEFINTIIDKAGVGQNISRGVLDDWHMCAGAKELYCAFTNFTLSALLFDKGKKYRMLSKANSNGSVVIHDPAYNCVNQMFSHYFTNATWM